MKRHGIAGFGTTIIVATIIAWFFVAPAAGSGWLIFVAYVGAATVFGNINQRLIVDVAAAATVSGIAGAFWYLGQTNGFSDSGYLLGLAVIVMLVALAKINAHK